LNTNITKFEWSKKKEIDELVQIALANVEASITQTKTLFELLFQQKAAVKNGAFPCVDDHCCGKKQTGVEATHRCYVCFEDAPHALRRAPHALRHARRRLS
jgi:hypothetical protein